MPPPQIFSLDGHAFGLAVSGVQLIDFIPTDVAPIRWEMPSEATTGGISFTVEDNGEHGLPSGSVVRLTDNVNNELLASGVLVNRRYRRGTGPLRYVECDVAGWGWYLDHCIVTEFVWDLSGQAVPYGYIDDHIKGLVSMHGGALTPAAGTPLAGLDARNPGTVSGVTLRSGIDTVYADSTATADLRLYVTNDAEVRWWSGDASDASLGTATYSIGDQGDYIPEDMTYEVGSENRVNLVAVYGTAGDFVGWGWVGTPDDPVSSWDAGQPSAKWEGAVEYTNPAAVAPVRVLPWYGDIRSISFTTTEYGGWKPHQALVVDDSMLTGGTAEVHYIAAVSGSIDYRNLVEYRVTTGAVARSIVQTVATP